MATLIPQEPVAVVPPVECCLKRVHRTAAADERPIDFAPDYDCGTDAHRRGRFRMITLSLDNPSSRCNEPDGLPQDANLVIGIPPVNQYVYRYRDGLGIFTGGFEIAGDGNPKLYTGIICLLDHVGTHLDLGEECNPYRHIEGWLIGTGGPNQPSDQALHLSIAGSFSTRDDPRTGAAMPTGKMDLVLNGVLTRIKT